MDTPSPHDSSARFIDRSRLVACRECRRSKIRCSRTVPCDACTRRGCTDICPDGIKETKRSKSDENLLQENARLVRRIRYLEGVLASLKHTAGSSSRKLDKDASSSDQDSPQPSMSPASDESETDILSDPHPYTDNNREKQSEASRASKPLSKPSSKPRGIKPPQLIEEPHLAQHLLNMLEHDLAPHMAYLTPGLQFTLNTLLKFCRTCGIFGRVECEDQELPILQDTAYDSSPNPLPPMQSLPSLSSPLPGNPLPTPPPSDSGWDSNHSGAATWLLHQGLWNTSQKEYTHIPTSVTQDQLNLESVDLLHVGDLPPRNVQPLDQTLNLDHVFNGWALGLT